MPKKYNIILDIDATLLQVFYGETLSQPLTMSRGPHDIDFFILESL